MAVSGFALRHGVALDHFGFVFGLWHALGVAPLGSGAAQFFCGLCNAVLFRFLGVYAFGTGFGRSFYLADFYLVDHGVYSA